MDNTDDRIITLLQKLEALYKRQEGLLDEINQLRSEIAKLKDDVAEAEVNREEKETIQSPLAPLEGHWAEEPPVHLKTGPFVSSPPENVSPRHRSFKTKSDFEKFIGENLVSKIGIIITILGIAIGAKYAIDKHLISPLTRILLGYLSGILLLGFSLRLREKYENFSAVLLSGSAAVLYFITYTAYSFYHLMPQIVAFALMILFTVFTVWAAIMYNKQVIAHIGLVGAYAVPFLLSTGSGEVAVLFTYMTIINIGIAFIAFKKYWKPLYHFSFVITWLIFGFWYFLSYQTGPDFNTALVFLFLFFCIFYLIFLSYKLLRKENFETTDIFFLLSNSFIFYGLGYSIFNDHSGGDKLLGLFTLSNGLLHGLVSVIIYGRRKADKNLLHFVLGLMLVFITIAIPVQLDGNWVTLLWAGEAAMLFSIGRRKNVYAYERIAYPVMVLAFCSLVHDWMIAYHNDDLQNRQTRLTPLLNIHFLTSLLCIAAFGWINFLHIRKPPVSMPQLKPWTTKVISFVIPLILLCTVYFSFRLEISNYWNFVSLDQSFNDYYAGMKRVWIINYTLLFFSILNLFNYKKIKSISLGRIALILTTITVFVFLTTGLYTLSELRDLRLKDTLLLFENKNPFIWSTRYISFGFVGLALFSCFRSLSRLETINLIRNAMDFVLHLTVLWIISSELIHRMEIAGSTQSYKLGLSILWGCYALFMIILGIRKRKQYLRIGAIALFGATLIKLFFYDLVYLDTISKTIVLVSLGVLLLIISFLYNKYKRII